MFGDFNNDTLVDSKSRTDYEKLRYAFEFKQQNFLPNSCYRYNIHMFESFNRKLPNANNPRNNY